MDRKTSKAAVSLGDGRVHGLSADVAVQTPDRGDNHRGSDGRVGFPYGAKTFLESDGN